MESPMVMKIDAKVLRNALPASTFRPNGKVAKISLFINISYFIPDFNYRLFTHYRKEKTSIRTLKS